MVIFDVPAELIPIIGSQVSLTDTEASTLSNLTDEGQTIWWNMKFGNMVSKLLPDSPHSSEELNAINLYRSGIHDDSIRTKLKNTTVGWSDLNIVTSRFVDYFNFESDKFSMRNRLKQFSKSDANIILQDLQKGKDIFDMKNTAYADKTYKELLNNPKVIGVMNPKNELTLVDIPKTIASDSGVNVSVENNNSNNDEAKSDYVTGLIMDSKTFVADNVSYSNENGITTGFVGTIKSLDKKFILIGLLLIGVVLVPKANNA